MLIGVTSTSWSLQLVWPHPIHNRSRFRAMWGEYSPVVYFFVQLSRWDHERFTVSKMVSKAKLLYGRFIIIPWNRQKKKDDVLVNIKRKKIALVLQFWRAFKGDQGARKIHFFAKRDYSLDTEWWPDQSSHPPLRWPLNKCWQYCNNRFYFSTTVCDGSLTVFLSGNCLNFFCRTTIFL